MTLKFDWWPLKTIEHPSYAASSFANHFIAIGEFKLELQSGNALFGSKSSTFFSRVTLKFDGWPWKINRAPLLSNIKLCASFHRHMWIQTGVTVRKLLSGVMTSVTLTFGLWPWPLAWTSRLSMVITPENFRMIRWQEHCQKGVTDGRTHYKTYTGYLSINLSGYHYWLLPVHYWLAKFTMHNWTLIGVSVQIMLGKSLT